MDNGINKLRGFLAFGRDKNERDEPSGLRAFLENLHGKSSADVISALTDVYLPAVAGVSNLHMRFKLLEAAHSEMDRCLPTLENYVSNAALPLGDKASSAALRADNFLKLLASTYLGLISGIEAQKMDNVLGHLMQQAARRAMQFLLRRQVLAYRAYATPSASTWQQMHTLYLTARSLRLAQGSGERQTVEQCYLAALLLAHVDLNKFRRADLDQIRTILEQLAPSAVIVEASSIPEGHPATPTRFFVQTNEGNAGKPIARVQAGTPRAGNFIVECRNVVAALDRRLNPADSTETAPPLDASETNLIALRTALGGQVTRRFHRQRFKPKADLVFGLPQLINFLNGNSLIRRQEDTLSEPSDFSVSEWAIVDESPDGFRVRYVKGEQQQFQAGDVVGLQHKDHSRIHVCILRRIASIGNGHLELGLQELSPEASVIAMPESDTNKGIFLHHLPGYAGRPGLILIPGTLPANEELMIEMDANSVRYKATRCIEENPVMELHLLETLTSPC